MSSRRGPKLVVGGLAWVVVALGLLEAGRRTGHAFPGGGPPPPCFKCPCKNCTYWEIPGGANRGVFFTGTGIKSSTAMTPVNSDAGCAGGPTNPAPNRDYWDVTGPAVVCSPPADPNVVTELDPTAGCVTVPGTQFNAPTRQCR
jgi:hypothetical protein